MPSYVTNTPPSPRAPIPTQLFSSPFFYPDTARADTPARPIIPVIDSYPLSSPSIPYSSELYNTWQRYPCIIDMFPTPNKNSKYYLHRFFTLMLSFRTSYRPPPNRAANAATYVSSMYTTTSSGSLRGIRACTRAPRASCAIRARRAGSCAVVGKDDVPLTVVLGFGNGRDLGHFGDKRGAETAAATGEGPAPEMSIADLAVQAPLD